MYRTVDDLLGVLTEVSDAGYGDCKVRIAYQPSWPLRARVENVTAIEDEEGGMVIWLAANESVYGEDPYAPREAWEPW